jgi:hypothetical protein
MQYALTVRRSLMGPPKRFYCGVISSQTGHYIPITGAVCVA